MDEVGRYSNSIQTKQSITVRMPNMSYPQFTTCNNQRCGGHVEITKDLLSMVEVQTGVKQINHEVSIMKNIGGMNHGVEGRQKQHANML